MAVELNRSPLDVLPAVIACFKDGGIRKVFGHLAHVPPLAYHHQAMGCSVIVNEDKVFMSCPHSLPQTRVALRGWVVIRIGDHLSGQFCLQP